VALLPLLLSLGLLDECAAVSFLLIRLIMQLARIVASCSSIDVVWLRVAFGLTIFADLRL
jgi:hypothetical protein